MNDGPSSGAGRIFGVGVGPGDPQMITLKAAAILGQVEVVVAPVARQGGRSLALEIARTHLSISCRIVETELPMTEEEPALTDAWRHAASLLVEEALAGHDAAFVTLGDCALYSTWPYVAEAIRGLAPQLQVEWVPGITAMSACAAHLGTSLAQGKEPLLVWVGPPSPDMVHWVESLPNLVFLKAAGSLREIAQLAARSASTATAVRRAGQRACQTTTTLTDWTDSADYFTTVLLKRKGIAQDEGGGQP